jgi:uncharacterized protein YndB with AHSA1/START domain
MNSPIIVQTFIHAPIEKIWHYWTEPEHIKNWYNASDDWHAPSVTNDLSVGGKFVTRMEAKDGSAGFDFGGTYTLIEEHKKIEYTIGDGRKVRIEFIKKEDGSEIIQSFEPEGINPIEMQKGGWQAILDNFKKYTESNM